MSITSTLPMHRAVVIQSACCIVRGSDLQVLKTDFLGTRKKKSIKITVGPNCEAKANPKMQIRASYEAPIKEDDW